MPTITEKRIPAAAPIDLVTKVYEPEEVNFTPGERSMVAWLTVETPDREGDVVVASGVDYKEYLSKNPIVAAFHDYGRWPVGQCEWIKIKKNKGFYGLVGKAVFDEDPDSELVWEKVKAETVRSVSIGFLSPLDMKPGEWGPPTREEIVKNPHWAKASRIIRRCVLIEYSVVPIGMHQDALVIAVNKGFHRPPKNTLSPETHSMADAIPATTAPADGAEPAITNPAADATPNTKGVVAFAACPLVDTSWDAEAAQKAIEAWATEDGAIDWRKYEQGFAWYDEQNPENLESYHLPHHEVVDGELVTSRRGVEAAAGLLSGAGDGCTVPWQCYYKAMNHLGGHFKQWGGCAPWEYECRAIGDSVNTKDVQATSGLASTTSKELSNSQAFDIPEGEDFDDTDENDEGEAPQELKRGDHVKIAGDGHKGVGKVVSVHRDGDFVPNVDQHVIGTADEPAARVHRYKCMGDNKYVKTGHYTGHKCMHLSKMDDEPEVVAVRASKGVDAAVSGVATAAPVAKQPATPPASGQPTRKSPSAASQTPKTPASDLPPLVGKTDAELVLEQLGALTKSLSPTAIKRAVNEAVAEKIGQI